MSAQPEEFSLPETPDPPSFPAPIRCGCERGCNAPFQSVGECPMHGADVRPSGRTIRNVECRNRVIE